MIALAIQNIRPNSNWYMEGETYDKLVWIDTEKSKPTEQEINDEIERIKQLRIDTQYQRDRAKSYPSIQEQLDMQYWDSVNGTTIWADTIATIKQQYPKSE